MGRSKLGCARHFVFPGLALVAEPIVKVTTRSLADHAETLNIGSTEYRPSPSLERSFSVDVPSLETDSIARSRFFCPIVSFLSPHRGALRRASNARLDEGWHLWTTNSSVA